MSQRGKYNGRLEKALIYEFGFKLKWLDDKSGYWLYKNFKLAGVKYHVVVESDHNLCELQVEVITDTKRKLKQFETIAVIPCKFKNISVMLHKYGILNKSDDAW